MGRGGLSIFLAGLLLLLGACDMPEPEKNLEPAQAEAPSFSGVLLPKGPLPEGQYAPPPAPERRYPEVTRTLIPRSDYGRIWPYVGGYAELMWMQGELYGLCDESGQIICDPVYSQVGILEKEGKRLYKFTKNLLDEKNQNVSKITLAALDGSWAKEYEGIGYECDGMEVAPGQVAGEEKILGRVCRWRQTVTYEYITVCEKGKWGAIDYEGNEILPCVYNAPVCFSEGLAAILSDDEKTVSFIDKTGKVVLGPYATPPRQEDPFDFAGLPWPLNHGLLFREGLVRFYEDGKFGVIDKRGRVIVLPDYDFITSFEAGTAQFIFGGANGVMDKDGRVLLEPAGAWLMHADDGTVLMDSPGGQMALDLITGEQTPWENPARSPSYTGGVGGVRIEWEGGELFDPESTNAVFLSSGNFALSNRDESWKIVNRQGEILAGPYGGEWADFARDGVIRVYISGTSGPTGYEMTLYDEEGKRLLPGSYKKAAALDGRYLARQKEVAGLLDEKGNWVIKVPLYDYIQD